MDAPRTARARARAEVTAEIKDLARAQLAEVGSAGLSVRAIARDLGMVSSAVYRYFPSRDDLLTALIVDAYDAVGAAAEQALAQPAPHAVARWLAVCRAIRTWALAHPHEYALIYGSPVPGYAAPTDTIGPATRVTLALAAVLAESPVPSEPIPDDPPVPPALAQDLDRVAGEVLPAGLPPATMVRALSAWTTVFGHVSLELFGHFENVITARAELFDAAMLSVARGVPLPGGPDASMAP